MSDASFAHRDLLGAHDPPPARILNADAAPPVLLVCDHAGNAVPAALQDLGLSAPVLSNEHVAMDLGAARVTEILATRMGCTAVLATYSRLVIDCNRPPGDPTAIPAVSDGMVVPGNQNISDADAERRLESCFWPYHHTIDREIARLRRHGLPPALVSVHSFTPRMRGSEPRPWHIGVLWKHDSRMARPLIDWFATIPDMCVGDNQPYSGHVVGFTIDTHAESSGLPHVLLEIRQDLIADETGCQRWAELIHTAVRDVLADGTIHRVEYF